MRRVGSARPCVPRVAIAPRLHPPRSLPLSCRPARFTSSSSSPLLEPELVRPISPGFRLRKARDIPVRQVTPQGAQEITAARLALRERESKGLPVQYTDLAALLERASRANDLTAAKEILADINLRRFKHTSPRALCSLMQAYARCDRLNDTELVAQQIWQAGFTPDVWCFNAWIGALVRQRRLTEAEEKFAEMQRLNLTPTVVTYHALLSGYANDGDKDKALNILNEMERLGLPWTEYTWTPLIYMYARRGEPNEVRALIDRLEATGVKPSARIYNSLLSALSKANQYDQMPGVLKQMVAQGVHPVSETYNILIAAHARLGDFAAAHERIIEMRDQRLPLDVLTYAPIIAARCKRDEGDEAEALLKQMKEDHIPPSASEGMLLINAWIRAGNFDRALAALRLLEDCGLHLTRGIYSPLVTAFAEARRWGDATKLVEEMQAKGITIDGWMTRFLTKNAIPSRESKPAPAPPPAKVNTTETKQEKPAAAAAATTTTTSPSSPAPSSTSTPTFTPPTSATTPTPRSPQQNPATGLAFHTKERTTHIRNLITARRIPEALRVLKSMETQGPEPSGHTYSVFLGYYGHIGDFDKIDEILDRMRERKIEIDAFTWSRLLRSYAHHKYAAQALRCWKMLLQKLQEEGGKSQPTPQNYHDVIVSLLQLDKLDEGVTLMRTMMDAGIKPLGGTFVWVVGESLKAGKAEETLELAGKMVAAGYALTEPLAGKVRALKAQQSGDV